MGNEIDAGRVDEIENETLREVNSDGRSILLARSSIATTTLRIIAAPTQTGIFPEENWMVLSLY